MIFLGLDPGLATTGYGLIEKKGSKFSLIKYGTIDSSAKQPFNERLLTIFNSLKTLINSFPIAQAGIESIIFNSNTKTAINVAQARGVLLLALELAGLPTASYSPPQVKLGVTGYGKASKSQIQYMVKKLLHLSTIPKPDDAADALGIAICHANNFAYSRKL